MLPLICTITAGHYVPLLCNSEQFQVTMYHKRLNMAESESRVLSEKLAALQQSHNEHEELVARLQERVAMLQNNLTDNEVCFKPSFMK